LFSFSLSVGIILGLSLFVFYLGKGLSQYQSMPVQNFVSLLKQMALIWLLGVAASVLLPRGRGGNTRRFLFRLLGGVVLLPASLIYRGAKLTFRALFVFFAPRRKQQ